MSILEKQLTLNVSNAKSIKDDEEQREKMKKENERLKQEAERLNNLVSEKS